AAALGAERFLREIEVTAGLTRPHILPLHDSGEAEGLLYYVMPYVAGESLRGRLERETQLPIDEALRITEQVASALEYAHRQDVIHRDIKPENILLHEGEAMVADFGIALAVSAAGGERLTETGISVGTVEYMSPEQATGEEVDARSDIYSLGCVLYEMLVGEPPYTGPTGMAVLAKRLSDPVPRARRLRGAIPEAVDAALARALATERVDRFGSAREFAEALVAEAAGGVEAVKSIVVLPFENLSSDPENAFFADGLTEELIADLSKVRALRVISRTSAMVFKGTSKKVPEIAEELKVRYVLEGSVRRAADSVRITAQLIEAATDKHQWADKYTGSLEDVFDLQERLSRRIVDALQVTLTGDEDRRLAMRMLPDVRAFDCYLRARQEMYRMTESGLDRALELIEEALAIVGPNALLYAALAEIYYLHQEGMVRLDEEPLEHADSWVAEALSLDPDSPAGLGSRGLIQYKRGELGGAVRDLRRCVELKPDGVSYAWLAWLYGLAGSMDAARRYADRAASLDPLFWTSRLAPGWVALLEGDFDTALDQARLVVDLTDGDPVTVFWLGVFAAIAQRTDEACQRLRQVAEAESAVESWKITCTVLEAALRGDVETVRHEFKTTDVLDVAKIDWTLSWLCAGVFTQIGETDEALGWLEKALELGFTNHRFFSAVDPFLAPLRDDAQFQALMDRMRDRQRTVEA
ncbi:MAG: protein kinase, partial [Gemmatimonadales bacterium]